MTVNTDDSMDDLRQIVDAFSSEVVNQYHEFNEFCFLYYTSPSQTELLNATANVFFGELFYILADRIVLNVSKLTDPPSTSGHENLSLRTVHKRCSVHSDYPKDKAEAIIQHLEATGLSVKNWRCKLTAHLDLKTAVRPADMTDEMKPSDSLEFYETVQEYLDLVYPSLFNTVFPIETTAQWGAADLVVALRQAQMFQSHEESETERAG